MTVFDATVITRSIANLVVLAVAALSWILAFIGVCMLASKSVLPGVYGFFTAYQLVLIVAVFVALATRAVATFGSAFSTLSAVGFVFAVYRLEGTVYSASIAGSGSVYSAYNLVSAGDVVLSLIFLLWTVVLAADPSAPAVAAFYPSGTSASLPGASALRPPGMSLRSSDYGYAPTATASDPTKFGITQPSTPMAMVSGPTSQPPPPQQPGTAAMAAGATPDQLTAPVRFRARAMYAYTAADPKEVTLAKDDVVDVLDDNGSWWFIRVRRSDGTVSSGIAPSNCE
ncbi:Transmembrane osmosensor [Cladochytrium tenue]|nr:Transmembrane osmosensor [Cladochytrium tenue]